MHGNPNPTVCLVDGSKSQARKPNKQVATVARMLAPEFAKLEIRRQHKLRLTSYGKPSDFREQISCLADPEASNKMTAGDARATTDAQFLHHSGISSTDDRKQNAQTRSNSNLHPSPPGSTCRRTE